MTEAEYTVIDRVGQQLGNYRLLRMLGQGAFATVYLGEHQYLERAAAIKVLHVRIEPQTHESFLREARMTARLRHPHIIDVYDFGIEDQTPYLVMEYTPNGSLRSQYPKGMRLPFEQIMVFVKQIASALDYAHEQHVIHRDIKPANILINSKQELVLSDFGIAVVQSMLDPLSPESPGGTPVYMAPEQIQGKPCAASDQYALGVMVYEWLCGEPPFHGRAMAVFAQHLHSPPPSLCARLPQLPLVVEDVVLGALAKDPQQRFSSVQDFAVALEQAFYSTQPLSLSGSVENRAQDETKPSLAHVGVVPVPMSSEPDPTDGDITQPQLETIRGSEEQRGRELTASTRSALLSPHALQQPPPVSIMCVCAPLDEGYLDQWEIHLHPLEQAGYLTIWSERHLLAGAPRIQQSNEHLQEADLLVLLLSADFFASEDCVVLMTQALLRHQRGEARVIPLLLRPVAWQESPLASLSSVPSNQRPVTEWVDQDAAFDVCVQEIRRAIGRPITTSLGQSQTSVSVLQNQNRLRLLKRVRSFWITGVLEHSLHGVSLMALGLQEQPHAVANPWHLVMQHPQTAPQPLPTGTRILQVYDASNGELLILGAPGSGKTTLLLELARDLLDRAERDEGHPLPMVFNLSSWAIKQQSLVTWLVEELVTNYQVPPKLGQRLVEVDQILPLLDGLDEVNAKHRTACIEAINTYRQDHGLLPLVVCSRSADYLEQTVRVRFGNAVTIQPLSQQQVDDYLAQAGKALQVLQVALQRNPTLRELTQTPLMLSILTLTYHGASIEDLLRDSVPTDRQQQVFERYIQRVLQPRGTTPSYPSQHTIGWLTWLAQQMERHGQTVFYIERMQPDWLVEKRVIQRHTRIVVGIIFCLLGLFALGPISGDFILTNPIFKSHALLFSGYVLIWTLLFGFINGILYPVDRAGPNISKRQRRWQSIIRSIQNGLLTGLLIGCPYGFVRNPSPDGMLSNMLVSGVLVGIIGGLTSGLIDALLNMQPETIQPAETVRWSWGSMGRNLVKFLGLGVLCVLLFGLLNGLLNGLVIMAINGGPLVDNVRFELLSAVSLIPYFALLGALVGGLTGGVSTTLLNERYITLPNLGIHRSVRHSVLVGIVSVWVVVVITILLALLLDPNAVVPPVLIIGPLAGLVNALRVGGIACIQHMALRWLLWKKKVMPRRYVRFLNYASEHVLLSKVGGGYMFVHRFLLEYFASLAVEQYLGSGQQEDVLPSPVLLGSHLDYDEYLQRNQDLHPDRGVEQEQISKEVKQEYQQALTAIAHVALEDDNTAFVGKSYTAYAGISQSKPDDFVGEAFEISIQHSEKPIPFDICLHTSENIELTTHWHKHLLYDLHNQDPHLTEFTFQVKLSEKNSYVVVDFYHERHWLRTIRFDFEAVEQVEHAGVTFGV